MTHQMELAPASTSLTQAPRPTLRRKCACGGTPGPTGECEQCRKKRLALQRQATSAAPAIAPPIVHDVLASPGHPLDGATRAFMEPRFGHSFAGVRVHTDARAAESAAAVGALAYTVGSDVAFAAGHYAPATTEGRRLLAHELAHVVQQDGSRGMVRSGLQVGPAEAPAEREAEQLAERISGAPPGDPSRVREEPAFVRRQVNPVKPQGAEEEVQAPPGCMPGLGPNLSGTGLNPTTAGKVIVALSDPEAAVTAASLADVAVAAAEGSGLAADGRYLGPFDAYRHSVWNCLMTRVLGVRLAEQFATGYENSEGSSVQFDRQMDLHNNTRGSHRGAARGQLRSQLHARSGGRAPANRTRTCDPGTGRSARTQPMHWGFQPAVAVTRRELMPSGK